MVYDLTMKTTVPPKSSVEIPFEEMKKMMKENERIAEIRGRIIGAALMVEKRLDRVLNLVFTGEDKLKGRLFTELVLDKEFFTFFQKYMLLKNLTNTEIIQFRKEEERKKSLKDIHDVVEFRNMFAHLEIIFIDGKPHLEYEKDGKKKTELLDEDYFKTKDELIYQTIHNLESLHRQLVKDHKK